MNAIQTIERALRAYDPVGARTTVADALVFGAEEVMR